MVIFIKNIGNFSEKLRFMKKFSENLFSKKRVHRRGKSIKVCMHTYKYIFFSEKLMANYIMAVFSLSDL